MRPGLLLAAVALGSSIIALGIYFGLRASSSGGSAPVPLESARASLDAVNADARAQLETRREVLVSRCWPTARGRTEPVNLTFSLAFDREGQEIARGVSADRNGGGDEIAGCVRERAREPLRVAPPGEPVSIEVPFVLP